MSVRAQDRIDRSIGMVLSDDEERRERSCRALVSEGLDVLAFIDPGDAQAWLDEETPSVAMLDRSAGRVTDAVAQTLEERGVRTLPMA